MKKQLTGLVLALVLALSGCASMLDQTFVSVAPHNKQPEAEVDNAAIRVEDYPQLVSAILYFVSSGQEEGVVRLHNYNDDSKVKTDLAAACDEVRREDPLGAYAVDGIKPSAPKRIVSYYEAVVTITYRRTPEQVAAIVPVTGSGAIRAELADTLGGFEPEVALRVNYFKDDAAYIEGLVRRAYYDTPAAALGMPRVSVSLYPEIGLQRIVEVTFQYGESADVLQEKSAALLAAASKLLPPEVAKPQDPAGLAEVLFTALREKAGEGGIQSTSYAALVTGSADTEGLALGYQLLCHLSGLECQVAQGTGPDGAPRFWTIVAVGEEYRHVDPSSPDGLLLTDLELDELGMRWSREDYPPCGEGKAEEALNAA